MKLILFIFLILISPILSDNRFRPENSKNSKSRNSHSEINSNRKNFIIFSIPNNNNYQAFKFMTEDNSDAFSMKYTIYNSNLINDLVSSQYTIKMHKLIQYIENTENPYNTNGYDVNDTICNNLYSPYNIGRARFLFYDDGIIIINNEQVKQIRAVDNQNLISFVYKFIIGNSSLGWNNKNNRQFINANSIKFYMLINTTNINNFFANDIQCRNKNSSEIKLALISYTKAKFKYINNVNQSDNYINNQDENKNSKYRTNINFGYLVF